MAAVHAPVLRGAAPQDQGGVPVGNLLRRDEDPIGQLRRLERLLAAVSVEPVDQRPLSEPLHRLVLAGPEGAGQHAGLRVKADHRNICNTTW